MKSVIIIPTFNERENIRLLIEELLKLPYEISIIIVDDNSPDGTGRIADDLACLHPEVRVIHRSGGKGGRGSACLAGFKEALKGDVDYIFEMDADFSHDPRELPYFFDKIVRSDIVIGSRYLPKSRIINWGFKRIFFSRLANIYARFLLGVPITDYTNGYRCYRKSILQKLDFNAINQRGYIVLSETAYQLYAKGAVFQDVPITFVNRKRGISNLSFKEIKDAFLAIPSIKWKST